MTLSRDDRTRHLRLALEEVLERMFYLSPDGEATLPAAIPEPWLAAQLRFTGPVEGDLGLAVRPETAAQLANNFLGQDCGQRPPAQLADILGELANMVAGSLLNHAARRPVFALSPPQPLPLSDASAGSRPCSPPVCPSLLPTAPQPQPSLQPDSRASFPAGLLSCSHSCPLACLSWQEICLTHEIVRAYAFEGQLFLAWLHCDEPAGAHRPFRNSPGLR